MRFGCLFFVVTGILLACVSSDDVTRGIALVGAALNALMFLDSKE